MPETTVITVAPLEMLALAILVLFAGAFVNERVAALGRNFIPPAVTGGLLFSLAVLAMRAPFGIELAFDMQLRDLFLLVFFSTVGLGATLTTLKAGGKALLLLTLVAGVFLLAQNSTGVMLAWAMGYHLGYGLFGGSISFAGGHGTAIAWGAEAAAAGLAAAEVVGIAFATFGLIAGGLLGGPVARHLVQRHGLVVRAPEAGVPVLLDGGEGVSPGEPGALFTILGTLLALSLCVVLGSLVNEQLFNQGVLLPGFLTAMLIGILIANVTMAAGRRLNPLTVEKFAEVSLNLFLAMSLMAMELWTLVVAIGPVLLAVAAQMLVMTLFAIWIVFRVMGRDYDAAVIASGFVGLGLGATPVAIANMDAVTRRFGASPKAFLVVPLVGAFFIDVLNAVTIKLFLGMMAGWTG